MKLYLVTRIEIVNIDNETIDDISNDSRTDSTIFESKEDAQDYLSDLYEQDKYDYFEELQNDGYSEETKEDECYHIEVWNCYGQGVSVIGKIETLELKKIKKKLKNLFTNN